MMGCGLKEDGIEIAMIFKQLVTTFITKEIRGCDKITVLSISILNTKERI